MWDVLRVHGLCENLLNKIKAFIEMLNCVEP